MAFHWKFSHHFCMVISNVRKSWSRQVAVSNWGNLENPCLQTCDIKEFDIVGLQKGVFKVSVIGDCYLATSGLPDIRDDKAEVMAKFSVECHKIFGVVTTELSYTFGSETTYLNLRCGLHYGPVTAGVLRGLRSRFEIFGDTANTTSRI